MTTTTYHHARWIAAFTLLSWLGEYIHNRFDLPQLTMLSPENSIPVLISVLLFLAWWQLPFRRATTLALLGWTWVQLIGGILSVFPLSFWPYYPAQTVMHYLMHVIYALVQLPLLVALLRHLKTGAQGSASIQI